MPQYTPPFSPTITYTLPTTTYTVYVAGSPQMSLATSLQIDSSVGKKSQASFVVRTTRGVQFAQFAQMAILDASGNLAFSGYVTTPTATPPGFQSSLLWSMTCIGQDYLAKKRTITVSYTNQTISYMATDIYNKVLASEGVIIGQIYSAVSITIPQAVFNLAKVSDALDALVKEASAAGVPWFWMIDQNKALWIGPYTTITGPAIDGMQIDQVNNPPKITWSNPSYRNTQWVTGGVAQTATQTETITGNGNARSFALGFQLQSAPTITIAAVVQTVGLKGTSGSQWYWAAGDNIIVQDSGQTVLANGATGTVSYVGQFPNTAYLSNPAQIAAQAAIDGTSGINEEVIVDRTLTSASNALSEGSALLTRYAQAGMQFQFQTKQSGLMPGQLCTANFPTLNMPNIQVLIETVSASDAQDGFNIWWTVTAVSGPYDVTWVDFFSALLQNATSANSINVGSSNQTSLLEEFATNIVPSATLTENVFSCPIPSPTLYPSASLFPC